jgi:hypothetical protein
MKRRRLLLRLKAQNRIAPIFLRSNHGRVFTTFPEQSRWRLVWLGPHTLAGYQTVVGFRGRVQTLFAFNRNYDKEGEILRPEATLAKVLGFLVERTKEGDEHGEKTLRPLRKGVIDIALRANVSHKIVDRYLGALASVTESQSLAELTEHACGAVSWRGRRTRGLRPLSEDDAALWEAVSQGDWIIAGFRNKDIRTRLYPGNPPTTPQRVLWQPEGACGLSERNLLFQVVTRARTIPIRA